MLSASKTPLRFHHAGCAVASIEAALADFRPFFSRVSEPVQVASQGVRVCFVEMQPGLYIELIEGTEKESAIADLLKRRITFYHLGFLVDSFEQALAALTEHNYRHLETFVSEAFGGGRCAFLMSGTRQLIEIMESGHDVMESSQWPQTS